MSEPMSRAMAPPNSLTRLPRARLVVTSAHGVVEVDREGHRYVGVLDAPGATVSIGGALSLKILCRAENSYPYVLEDPQDLTVHVLAIDDAETVGTRQLLRPGVGLEVAVSVSSSAGRSPLAPPLPMPVIVGDSLDDALANAVLADALEPNPNDGTRDDDFDNDVITGSFRRLPLSELVQALSFAKKTVAIHVRVRGGSGVIHLDNGEVSCAQLDDDPRHAILRGPPAFHRLIAYDEGSFRVSFEKEWHERNVHVSTQMLLLDGLRMLDEARRDARGDKHALNAIDEEQHVDDAAIEEITFDLEPVAVRPPMRAHFVSPLAPSHGTGGVARHGRRLPPVLSSVLVAPRSSTR